jgi:repressor LexA
MLKLRGCKYYVINNSRRIKEMEIKDLIKTRRLQRGMTMRELAEKIGVSEATVSRWEDGKIKSWRWDRAKAISEALDIPANVLMTGTEIELPEYENTHAIPILGEICAGPGIFCDENYNGAFYIDRSIKADCCLIVSGDSMRDAGIMDRDIAFVKKQDRYRDGDIVAVIIRDENTAAIKKICFNGPDAVLMPCNPDYPPAVIALEEIIIVGKVIGAYRSLQ